MGLVALVSIRISIFLIGDPCNLSEPRVDYALLMWIILFAELN